MLGCRERYRTASATERWGARTGRNSVGGPFGCSDLLNRERNQ